MRAYVASQCGILHASAVHSSLGVNKNDVHMYTHVYIIALYAHTYTMYMAHCIAPGTQRGSVWYALHNADYTAHMRLQLVLQRGCLLQYAVHMPGSCVPVFASGAFL